MTTLEHFSDRLYTVFDLTWFAEKVRGVIFSFLSLWLQFFIENVLIGIFVEQ